jgi:O-antigen/teichoic acid export membrane protein
VTTPDAPKVQAADRGSFARAVLVLVSGTALAQALSAAALPVLSRLYSPTDFGMLAVFASVLSIFSVAACLRYELAVPLPENDSDAINLVALAIVCALGISSLLALPTLIAPDWIAKKLGQPALAPHLWLLPIGVFLTGFYSVLQFWFVRRKSFTLLARTRIAQSACSAGTQIGFGWWTLAGPLGLLLGYVMNSGTACLTLGWQLIRFVPQLSWAGMRVVALEYRRFPKYSTMEALANSASIQVPIVMIAALAAPAEAGYLMMAMFVMQAPMSLIGTAISQVFLSKAAQEYRRDSLGAFTTEVLIGLLRAGVGPLLAAAILSPTLFSIALGANWQRAGYLVVWMTPWYIMQFISSPISMALHVSGHQGRAFFLQAAGLLIRVCAVLAATAIAPSALSEAYAVSGFVAYGAYLVVILWSVNIPVRKLSGSIREVILISSCWIAGAESILFLINYLRPHQ